MNKKHIQISALLITFNEEKHIDAVIENIDFADEIIVVDSFSTDETLIKLKGFPRVTVISRTFENFADQRNYAIDQAKYDWILFIDADERIPENLRQEILNVVKNTDEIVAYMFKRRFFFNEKVMRFSGLQSDTTYRLFRKGYAKYDENKIVHENLIVDGKSAVLKHYMLHYCYTSNADYKRKMEYYASLKAKELYNKGKKVNLLHLILRPVYKFITNYVVRLGFLDGIEGFNVCYLSAYGVWHRYKELQRLNSLPKL
ncbi:glycosyltransferase family 2 protein [Hyunsoonleella sp. SJ7]|uniref:Glycosyltransferase family 2 protein n=1 Tax=Hyunsoonleella aquatilis TaxID=2762758 RepID=A0A923KH22_9FLAO|nr:glycosyltransferase family 2 protein [Hyunsoonleella aquatilis]MBC3759546.1 glycosyltransferase family 2 protein [Hyunsoonleella aquatilis]